MRSPTRGIWLASFLTVTLISVSVDAHGGCAACQAKAQATGTKSSYCVCGDNIVTCREYSIGAMVNPTGSYGLVVTCVSVDYPAHEAGLRRDDILLTASEYENPSEFDKRHLRQVVDLSDAIDKAKGHVLYLTVLRNGSTQTLKVTAKPRSAAGGVTREEVEAIFNRMSNERAKAATKGN